MGTVGMLQHLGQIRDRGEWELELIIVGRVIVDQRRNVPQLQNGIHTILTHYFFHGK
jgi:hypothetical protein